jgi:HK97 family phage portal protein
MANWWAPWTWFGEGQSHGDNFIRNLTDGTPGKLGRIDEHTALRLSAVLCAVRVIAEGMAQIPLKVFEEVEKDGQTVRRPAKNHPAYKVLHRRPNAWMTSFEWRELMTMHAVLLGSGFSIINSVRGDIDELIPVHPAAVQILFENNDVRYRISVNGKQADFAREEVFHLRGPSMDGVTALPIVKLAARAIGLSQALEFQQTSLQENGGRPSGILTYSGGKIGKEEKDSVAEAWRNKFGPGGPGGVAVLEKAWEFHTMAMSAVDAQHIESRRMQIEEIGRIFRVQPIMMMQSDKAATYASAEQMFLAHIIHTLGPWVDRWEHAIDRDLLDEDTYSHFQVNGLMRGAARDRAEYYTRALGSGGSPAWHTQNEVRALEDLDPIPGGDVLFRPPNTEQGQQDPDEPEAEAPPPSPDDEE